jgi:hypothetical protein
MVKKTIKFLSVLVLVLVLMSIITTLLFISKDTKYFVIGDYIGE